MPYADASRDLTAEPAQRRGSRLARRTAGCRRQFGHLQAGRTACAADMRCNDNVLETSPTSSRGNGPSPTAAFGKCATGEDAAQPNRASSRRP